METNYLSKKQQIGINDRFIKWLDNNIGYQGHKRFKGITEFAKELGVSRPLIYNIKSGKNNVTLPLLASVQNMMGSDFDARTIITGKKFMNKSKYNLPDGIVAVPVDELNELLGYTDMVNFKGKVIRSYVQNQMENRGKGRSKTPQSPSA